MFNVDFVSVQFSQKVTLMNLKYPDISHHFRHAYSFLRLSYRQHSLMSQRPLLALFANPILFGTNHSFPVVQPRVVCKRAVCQINPPEWHTLLWRPRKCLWVLAFGFFRGKVKKVCARTPLCLCLFMEVAATL